MAARSSSMNVVGAFFAVLVVVVAAVYQLNVAPRNRVMGVGRALVPKNNERCRTVQGLEACEKIVLHDSTGVLFAACSTIDSRVNWLPALAHLNGSGRSEDDHVKRYNPTNGDITRLRLVDFPSMRGLSVHGMDIVQSSVNPEELFVYLVNHRLPLNGQDPRIVGADSSIEVFTTTLHGDALKYVHTFEDETIVATPNDVVGASDGRSVYFTNDHGPRKAGWMRYVDFLLGRHIGTVGFCDVDQGCTIVASGLRGANGLTRRPVNSSTDGSLELYVGSDRSTDIYILTAQADGSLVQTDRIRHEFGAMDNIAVSADGTLIACAPPHVSHFVDVHLSDPHRTISPSGALRISPNTGRDAFFGRKWAVERLFEDDGHTVSGATSAVYDSTRRRLYLHGIAAPHLSICEVSEPL